MSDAQFDSMILEAKAMQNMYNRMTDMCFKKCISRFGEGELAAGETTCIDRCCLKYIQVQNKVSIKLNPEGAKAQGLTDPN
jgi:import inner membrane translocase subunit TIM10